MAGGLSMQKCSSWIPGSSKCLDEDQRDKEIEAFQITGLKAQKIRVLLSASRGKNYGSQTS